MRFLADENFPLPAIISLRQAGHDVRSVMEERPGISDEEVADLCEQDGRTLLTFDKDFGDLVFRRGFRAGVAVVLFRFIPESPEEPAKLTQSLLAVDFLQPGSFYVVTRQGIRVRPLQLRQNS